MKIRDLRHHTRNAILMAAAAVSLLACGGGGGSSSPTSMRAHSAARTFGTVRAFGSVFVDGHEFDSSGATVVDDDTGATVPGSAAGSSLAVGMTVDVKPSASSTDAAPSAQEIRVITLARGPVDASDSMAGQLSVMGQVVQLTATSVFKDARSCAQGTSPMCTPITDQSGLTANCSHSGTAAYTCTSGSGTSVQVFGYVNASASTSTLTAPPGARVTLIYTNDTPLPHDWHLFDGSSGSAPTLAQTAIITGPHATPKGLRHAFGIKGVGSQVPLNMVQKWLGHAELSTTAIYVDAVGAEAKQIAQRMWG